MTSQDTDDLNSKITVSREDFWTVLAIEQDQIATEYEKAIQDLLSLEEPLSSVQSVVNRMHDQTQRYRIGLKRKDAEIKEKEEKIDKLHKTLDKYKNSITIDQKLAIEEDLTKLQKQVDVSHIREQDLQETVDYLRKQVKNLETAIEQKEVEAAELDADLELMGRTREGMQKEKEKMKRVMLQTEAMVNTANAEREEYARLYQSSKGIIDDLKKQFSEKITEAEQLTQQTTESEVMINDLRKNYDEIATAYENLYDAYMDCFKQLAVHRETNQELAAGLEELYKENEEYEENEKTLKRKINILRVRIGASEQRFAELTADYEAQCKEVEKLTSDVHKLKTVASKQPTPQKQTNPSLSKGMVATEPLHMKQFADSEIHHLEKIIREKDKKLHDLKNMIDSLQAEKKVMTENASKIIGLNSELQEQLKSQANSLKAMDQFLTDARQQWRDCKTNRDALEREKRKYQLEKSKLISKLNEATDSAHNYEEQLMMTRRQLVEKTMQLKREKNNVEVVKAERNSQHAKWQETKSMLQDQARICKIEATQIQQLKEEVSSRDKQLTKEHLSVKKLTTKYNSIVLYESKLEKKIEEMKNEAMKFEALKKKFENEKKEDEKETQAIMKRQAKYQKEMANISTMLDRRLVELGLLYEKIDLLNNMLRQGENQYKERIEDIRLLKLEVRRLRHQNQVLQATFKNMADLRHEIFHLNRDLATERQKCHALQEELETPINFHRWRILQGTDPDKRNLIDKVQILQKKLLKEVEARAIEKERFKDLEAVYHQLKRKLVSLPGTDIQSVLNNTKKALKEKIEDNRILETTITAYEGEMQDYKYRLDQLQKQHDELKTKFFNHKRAQDKTKMKQFEIRNNQRPEVNEKKIVLGGGFTMERLDD